jgi:polar amino acid transport system substrate-binding protein
MFFSRFNHRLALPALLLIPLSGLLIVAHEPASAQEVERAPATSSSVVIPNFWDPRSRIERPPVGTIPAIRFITTDDFPPFNFLDANGRLTGFNVDLARAICDELGIRCTIQSREWAELPDRIADRTADAAIAGIAVTAENRTALDFSDVYMRTPARFVVRKEDAGLATTPAGLRGKTLAVVANTAHEAYLAAMFPEVGRRLYQTADEARAAVKNGEAAAHFGDGLQLAFWLQSEAADGCCVFAGGPFLESRFFGQGYSIAVSKTANPDLKRAINAALQAIYEKGVFAELYLRYFPVGFF